MATTTTTSSSSTQIDPWLAAALQDIFKEGGNIYDQRSTYTPYPGPRIAQFTPLQQQAFQLAQQGIGRFSPLLDQASGALGQAQQGLGSLNYAPSSFQSNFTPVGYVPDYKASNYQPQFSSSNFSSGYQAGQVSSPYTDQLARQALEASRSGSPVSAQQVSTPDWDAQQRDRYMSPYMQGVVDIAKREAERDFSKGLVDINAAATRAGSFGGSRHGVVESEARRNLAQQLGDIQTQGLQRGYENAQQQFGADRQAREQADIANQNAALQAGISSQDILQRGIGLGLGALGQAGQLGLSGAQATEAARQQQGQFGLQAQQMGEASRQYGAGLGLQGEQVRQQSGQFGANLGLQGAQLAAQQNQFGSQQNLQAQQLGEASRQFGAGQRLSALQGLAGLAPQYGQLGMLGTQMQLQDVNSLLGVGAQQQGLNQQNLSLGYQDFLRQQQYPQDQLSWYNSIVRGTPYGSSTQTTQTSPAPSFAQQAAGIGLGTAGILGLTGAYSGLSNWLGLKDGGLVTRKGFRQSKGYAQGGLVKGYQFGGAVGPDDGIASVIPPMKRMSDLDLVEMLKTLPPGSPYSESIKSELRFRHALRGESADQGYPSLENMPTAQAETPDFRGKEDPIYNADYAKGRMPVREPTTEDYWMKRNLPVGPGSLTRHLPGRFLEEPGHPSEEAQQPATGLRALYGRYNAMRESPVADRIKGYLNKDLAERFPLNYRSEGPPEGGPVRIPPSEGPPEGGPVYPGIASQGPMASEAATRRGVEGLMPQVEEEAAPLSPQASASSPQASASNSLINPWMAAALAGFGMAASNKPTFLGALGEGAVGGLTTAAKLGLEESRMRHEDKRSDIAERQLNLREKEFEIIKTGQLLNAQQAVQARILDAQQRGDDRAAAQEQRRLEAIDKQISRANQNFENARKHISAEYQKEGEELSTSKVREVNYRAALMAPESPTAQMFLKEKLSGIIEAEKTEKDPIKKKQLFQEGSQLLKLLQRYGVQ